MGQPEVSVLLEVPFYDVDSMQVVWHGHYFKYFEMARHAMFRRAGIDLFRYHRETGYLFPVIKGSIKHSHPLRYGDKFWAKAVLVEARIKIVLDFELRLVDSGKLCAKGRGEQCAVKGPDLELEMVIPEDIAQALWAVA
ncbi:MAG: acyl-CoA thioesterase [Deltaproteobacteria bacterium]|nr:acyl-CoA thioesterase [Deltaproteobacteria bacterium]